MSMSYELFHSKHILLSSSSICTIPYKFDDDDDDDDDAPSVTVLYRMWKLLYRNSYIGPSSRNSYVQGMHVHQPSSCLGIPMSFFQLEPMTNRCKHKEMKSNEMKGQVSNVGQTHTQALYIHTRRK